MKFALRGWRRTPGFAVAAIATLGLGLGANTAIFSLVSGVLLRPLPFPHPQELAQLTVSSPAEPGLPPTFVTAGDLTTWRRDAASLVSASTYSPFSQNLQGVDAPEQVATVRADRSFFSTLGVPAMLGHTFGEGDPPNVVVASYSFWQRHLNSDSRAIGRVIVLDGAPFEVAGVMPAGFQFPYRTTATDLWTVWAPPSATNARTDAVIGRLKSGVSIERARGELTGLSGRLAPGRYANVTRLSDVIAGPVRESLLVLLGAVGFVLLIACANVANLLLARAAARSREVAVRMALGAGRGRLIRQFLAESLLLAMCGGLVGLVVGTWTSGLLVALAGSQIPRASEIGVDWRVFAFVFSACVLTGIGFGIAPAIGAGRLVVQDHLKSGDRGGAARGWLQGGLVVAEVALAFVLLTGAGLLLRTFLNLRGTPAGFDASNVLTLHLVVADAAESDALQQRVARIPGVRAVGFISLLPLQTSNWNGRFTVKGRSGVGSAEFRYVTPGYFATMSIPIRRGRALSATDTASSPKVLLVNETFVRQYLPGEDPIGRELTDRGTIVGVVGDVHQASLDRAVLPEIYYPVAQNFAQLRSVGSSMVVSSALPPESLVRTIRRAIQEISPTQATFRVASMSRVVDDSLGSQRLYLWLLGAFAAMGTLLAAAGLYGVIAYVVSLRTREFGIRMALGADARRVLGMVMVRGCALVGLGLAIGAGGAFLLARLLKSVLYGVTTTDARTFGMVAALLAAVALGACFVPARRAARADPAVALRSE